MWTPEETSDLHGFLSSAVNDTRNGLFEQALKKFEWFHENALNIEPGFSGVRLSFALTYWLDLAGEYPPAKGAYIRVRDATEKAFSECPNDFNLFHDLASLNSHIGEGLRTAEIFSKVARDDRNAAQVLYHVAEPHLIAAGQFHECAPFLDINQRLELQTQIYQMSKEHEDSLPRDGLSPPRLARIHFVDDIAKFVALLALNDRKPDARHTCEKALEVVDDKEFRNMLDEAMTGHFPEERKWE